MRHVDASRFTVPERWRKKAARALSAVETAIQAGHAPKFRSIWTDPDVRDPLIALVGQKCWYCETNVHSSNPDVDHYRPKNGPSTPGGHRGYWWLAYAPENYRIACSYCNSGGGRLDDGTRPAAKVARFPLLVESDRATGPENIDREKPVLLDPADKADHFLIDFSADGRTQRRGTIALTALEKATGLCRVTVSRDVYQLDRELLIEDRKGVMSDVRDLAMLMPIAAGGPSSISDHLEKKLRALIDPRRPYSGAAMSALRAARDEPLIQETFATELAADMPAAVPPEEAQPPVIDIAHLIQAHVIEPGAELIGHGAAGDVTAMLLPDGRIRVGARTYAAPDSAAMAASGAANIDGWTFWRTSREGNLVTLSELRDIAVRRLCCPSPLTITIHPRLQGPSRG